MLVPEEGYLINILFCENENIYCGFQPYKVTTYPEEVHYNILIYNVGLLGQDPSWVYPTTKLFAYKSCIMYYNEAGHTYSEELYKPKPNLKNVAMVSQPYRVTTNLKKSSGSVQHHKTQYGRIQHVGTPEPSVQIPSGVLGSADVHCQKG